MRTYSVIIPVYNRPDEVGELLESLARQTHRPFEVIVVEDGSRVPCEAVVQTFVGQLNVRYFAKDNSGQGFTRNYGFRQASGEYLVVFDSDCLVPPHYFEAVEKHLATHPLDAYGGPDRAHPDFTPVQKAISYAMTSFFTTGGTRGSRRHVGVFHPRSFNMGISREVFQKTGGYLLTRMGEDIEFSLRIIGHGFRTGLIEEAYVYHKRRTDFGQFFRQLHFFGRARINIQRFFPKEIKPVHTIPALFTLFLLGLPLTAWLLPLLFRWGIFVLLLYTGLILVDSTRKNKSAAVGILSAAAVFVQMTGYGIGFLTEGWRRLGER
ncbi:MAG: glycosyltransferase [Ferruginibacter sp.]|nr:glycosyltransferase [Cytophagales bacterium]